uniref:Uncharacterized protein n=1 Tax=Anopheles funestus TaxID=62324 RepID=A0A182RBZ9_ANOFN
MPDDDSEEIIDPTVVPSASCQVRTNVEPDTNASFIIVDRIYDITTLDQSSAAVELPGILMPIKEYRCFTVRVQSQQQLNATEMVEGILEIFCGLKLLIRFTFWINQATGCTYLFLENIRVDLERCGTIDPANSDTFYYLSIESNSKIVFRLGYESSPTLQESTYLPNYDLKTTGPPSIEEMWKCNCTVAKEAFKALRMCVIGSVNNITKLAVHISMIVSIGIGTTCSLMLIVWLIRKIWNIIEKL